MTRKFILCIGASKSGTTWLYHYLRQQSNVALGFRKEYNALCHIFGSPHIDVATPEVRIKSQLGDKIASIQLAHRKMRESVDEYCSYFDSLTPDGGISMDISPSYLSLKSENITEVLLRFIEKGFSTYVVLLLRDPIDRIVSFSKMAKKYKLLRKHLGISDIDTLQDVADKLILDSEFNVDYASSIRNLLMVDTKVKKFIYPYENLMSQEGVAHLSSSLQLERLDGFENEFYNRGESVVEGDITVSDHLRTILSVQYEFCGDFFASQGINLRWRQFS